MKPQEAMHPPNNKHPFLPDDFTVTKWEAIKPYYDQLLARALSSLADLKQWFLDRNELEVAIAEDAGWRYINMTRDTANDTYLKRYEYYVTEILPKATLLAHELNKKVVGCPHTQALRQEVGFDILLRCIDNSIAIYRPENIPLQTKTQLKGREYGQLVGAMTVTVDGQELTLQQAGVHLESPDRNLRETVYTQINDRRLQDKDTLNSVYTELIQDRHQMALNAGFDNFRDYAFVAMNRFDYTPSDCFAFHEAVAQEVVPLLDTLAQERQCMLGISSLKPWDMQVDPTGKPPLKPFDNAEELLQKAIIVFDRLDPFFGDCLKKMEQMGHFDLESRKRKAPGGYNYPLDKTGVPFIFMNATSTLRDMGTMLHEGGHAVHAFLTQDLLLHAFKQVPSELA
ncbi:MAG: M3 family metallopeptidase, partial [Bacteroidota bacterium]